MAGETAVISQAYGRLISNAAQKKRNANVTPKSLQGVIGQLLVEVTVHVLGVKKLSSLAAASPVRQWSLICRHFSQHTDTTSSDADPVQGKPYTKTSGYKNLEQFTYCRSLSFSYNELRSGKGSRRKSVHS